MSLKTWMSAYMSIPAEKCTKSWKLGLATMILKYTGSSKKILHRHWVERDGLDLFDDTSRIRIYGMEALCFRAEKRCCKDIGITVETLRYEDWMRMCSYCPLEYKCESHNSPSRVFIKTGDEKPMVQELVKTLSQVVK